MQNYQDSKIILSRPFRKAREDSKMRPHQRRIDNTVERFFNDRSHPSLSLEPLSRIEQEDIWSFRVNDDIRIIAWELDGCWVLCYVGHHDDAYRWARGRQLTIDLINGSISFAPRASEVPPPDTPSSETPEHAPSRPLIGYEVKQLERLGIRRDWAERFRESTREEIDSYLERAIDNDWFEEEAIERVIDLLNGRPYKELVPPQISVLLPSELFRRKTREFWSPESVEELRKVINAGWQEWLVYLHPLQKEAVERDSRKPIRVTGGAGTGKTVVAVHRTAKLAVQDPEARILVTTFTKTLAQSLRERLELRFGPLQGTSVEVNHLHSLATQIVSEYIPISIAEERGIQTLINEYCSRFANRGAMDPRLLTDSFLFNEWKLIIDAWNVRTLEQYLATERIGRKTALHPEQRKRICPVFEAVWQWLEREGKTTFAQVCYKAAEIVRQNPYLRYRYVIVDEAQDFKAPELTLIRALAPEDLPNSLFLCADARQRIYSPALPWLHFGIDTRGTSTVLRVNYRTTAQIQQVGEHCLPKQVEGMQEDEAQLLKERPLCLLHGETPKIYAYQNFEAEQRGLKEWIRRLIQEENFRPGEIAIFGRSRSVIEKLIKPVCDEIEKQLGYQSQQIDGESPIQEHLLNYGTTHNSKGLEFRAVAVVGVTRGHFPNYSALSEAGNDPWERKEVEDKERQLLYTVCTRARERLYISWSPPAEKSEFLHGLPTSMS